MLFNVIVLLLILAATAYFATQGLLSSLLALVTATFSSLLAMGLFESLQGSVAAYWPHLARAVAFLAVFTVTFAVTRFGADMLVPKNIKLPKMIDTAAGGVLGFFAILVIVGTSVLGVEMLPVHTAILGVGGDQEYPNEARMQGAKQGEVEPDDGLSMWPQHFTLALWNGASGRALGGEKAFASVHPDLPMESYGYRNVTQYGSNPALPADLLIVEGPYVTDNAAVLQKYNIDAASQAAVLRIIVKKGSDSPHISCDPDNMFRITPTQLRLVTDKGQRYPIGILSKGTAFEGLTLDVGHVVDDYVAEKVIEDWVFQLDKDEKPQFVEVKQLARAPVTVSAKPLSVKPATEYPQQAYKKDAGSISLTVLGDNDKPMGDITVRLVLGSIDVKKVETAIANANSHVEDALQKSDDSVEPWVSGFGKPGVPSKNAMKQAHQQANVGNANQISWNWLVSLLMMGGTEANGEKNHNAMPSYFQSKVVPILTPELRGEPAKTGADGKVMLRNVAPGDYCLIADGKTDSGAYYVWALNVHVDKKTEATAEMKAGSPVYVLTPVK